MKYRVHPLEIKGKDVQKVGTQWESAYYREVKDQSAAACIKYFTNGQALTCANRS